MPIFNKAGKAIGVTQALNKRGGPFTAEDESRLRAFTAQIASGLENAKLFADVQAMRNYNEAMLQSMSNGVVTFDGEGLAQTCNAAGGRILRREAEELVGQLVRRSFSATRTSGCASGCSASRTSSSTELAMDAELRVGDETVSANVTVLPLLGDEQRRISARS